MMDNTQTITDTFNYWPYGDIQSRTGTTATPFQFVGTRGYYKDSASINTKQYVRARHYEVAKCRWMTQDPIGFDGLDWNVYRYVASNPKTWTDESGLKPRKHPSLRNLKVLGLVFGVYSARITRMVAD